MSAIVDHVIALPTLLLALLIFGFAPGAVLRLIVLAFPRDDSRRPELLAELHGVPRIERPFWVAEQLEVALFEGLGGRIKRSAPKLKAAAVPGGWLRPVLATTAAVIVAVVAVLAIPALRQSVIPPSNANANSNQGRTHETPGTIPGQHGRSAK